MGKIVVIPGADFSRNGFVAGVGGGGDIDTPTPSVTFIDAIKTSVAGQEVVLPLPSGVTTNYPYEVEFQTDSISSNNQYQSFISIDTNNTTASKKQTSFVYVGNITNQNIVAMFRSVRAEFGSDVIPATSRLKVKVDSSNTVVSVNGGSSKTYSNSIGSLAATTVINSVKLFENYISSSTYKFPAGSVRIKSVTLYNPSTGSKVVDYVAAKDENGKVCMYDTVSGTKAYADSGDLSQGTLS